VKTRCIILVCRDEMWLFACIFAPELVQGGWPNKPKAWSIENLLPTDIT